MKKFVLVVLSLFIGNIVFAQDTIPPAPVQHAAYIEFTGNQGNNTLNYERIFTLKPLLNIAARIGIGAYHLKDFTNRFNPDLVIPVAVNAWYGKNHHIEMGIGETITSMVNYDVQEADKVRDQFIHTQFNIGYRYQKQHKGLLFRCGYTPFLAFNKTWRHWGGFSLGYAF